MEYKSLQAVVLAAGRATRFKTAKSKQLFMLCGQPMILYPLSMLERLKVPITLVLGYQAEKIRGAIEKAGISGVTSILQPEVRGTGDAVLCSRQTWDADNILILNGDLPLLTSTTVTQLYEKRRKANATISFLTMHAFDPTGYGRVIQNDTLWRIVEEKECTNEQRKVNHVNSGVYLIRRCFLDDAIQQLKANSITGEIHLPDLIYLACKAGLTVRPISVPFDVVRGVNTLQDLWEVEQIKRAELIKNYMAQGVRFVLPQTVHIDASVTISEDSCIGAGVQLLQNTHIGKNCHIDAYSVISNSKIGDNTRIYSHSVIHDSNLGSSVQVGPFARLRENVELKDRAVIGNFVEVKKSTIGVGTKAKHLSYLGNATVGPSVNIGAGTITCNHDGVRRHETVIEENAYIGSNTILVAPMKVGKGAYTAAGSIITNKVESNDLAIARARQVNKRGYALKLRDRAQKEAKAASEKSCEKEDDSSVSSELSKDSSQERI
jgi:bifunctional UDP-N-acetylglucosamine pyrophosphorylase/glucosamine-1-phosphate N-acetyltransferase